MGKRVIDRRRRRKTKHVEEELASEEKQQPSDKESSPEDEEKGVAAAPEQSDASDDDSVQEEEEEPSAVKSDSSFEEKKPAAKKPAARKRTVRSATATKRRTVRKPKIAPKKEKPLKSSDEDDDDYKPNNQRKRTAPKKKKKKAESSSEEELESDQWDSEKESSDASWDSDEPKPKRRRAVLDISSEEEEDENGEDDGDDDSPRRHTPARRSATRARTRLSANRDDDEGEDSDVVLPKPHKGDEDEDYHPRGRRRRGSRVTADSDDDEEDDEEEEASPRRHTPTRKSATRARTRLSASHEDDEEDEDDIVVPKTRSKRDDDEDFDPDADEDEEEEEASEVSSAVSSDKSEQLSADEDDDKVGNVDVQQDFLTADSSDDESPKGPSPVLNIKYSSRRGRSAEPPQDEFSSDSDTDEPELLQSPHMPHCETEEDAITMDELPSKHICFISPDQTSKQCFALETLYKIALSRCVRDEEGKPTFLQPPHFRTRASDDLIDQIASRFGRAALDLQGDFYKRGQNNYGYRVSLSETLEDNETFQERLNDYISHCMGSRDIYCCPLCYIESHQRITNVNNGEDEDLGDDDSSQDGEHRKQISISLWHDPMTVLGFLDSDQFKLASVVCFSKIVQVKRHLREDHNVDTKALASNELFSRFKIRDSDGLLQRFIEHNFKGHTFQGDMRRYWNAGNNQSFIYLLYLMERTARLKDKLDAGEDDTGEATTLFGDARDFFDSFANRAKHTWDDLSAPYRKATKEEMKDFVVEGGDDAEEDATPRYVFSREEEVDPEEEIVKALRRKRGESYNKSDDSDDQSGSEEESAAASQKSDAEEETLDDIPGYYSEEEEETDEWVTSKLAKRTPSSRKKPRDKKKVLGKRLGKARGADRLETPPAGLKQEHPVSNASTQTGKKKRTPVIVDSDSD